MENLWRAATRQDPNPEDYKGVDFWTNPERAGWLTKQGDYIKTWRRRWFVLKRGKLLWFKDPGSVTRTSAPRGVVSVDLCLTVKGAEDIVKKAFAFELSTRDSTMYFVADTEKDREDWINSIGRSIVQHSRSVTDSEVVDYDSKTRQHNSLSNNKEYFDESVASGSGCSDPRSGGEKFYDVPIGLFSENLAMQLGNFLGDFLEYDGSNLGKENRNFMSIRVQIDDLSLRAQSRRALTMNSIWLHEEGEGNVGGISGNNRGLGNGQQKAENKKRFEKIVDPVLDQVHTTMDHDLEDAALIGEEEKKRSREEIDDLPEKDEINKVMSRNRRMVELDHLLSATAKRQAGQAQ
ncbi:hypothetical protein CXB51_016278 [Gossypium anomalum]|uniref:PH domain-containing protein n=2 Tax=Gossypium TaxID=3633 RepID=A0A8J5YE79_9ROSI|nr:hypothetical protein CXB51_016278 [Gossypium anomalum]